MSLTLSTTLRNAAGAAIVEKIDDGSTHPNGYIEFRTGSKPTSPQVAATGTLLATLDFSNPAYGSFVNGTARVNTVTSDLNVAASGVCGWFRIYDRDDVALIDGTVTITGGGGDIEFSNIDFVQGGTVALGSLDAIMPA